MEVEYIEEFYYAINIVRKSIGLYIHIGRSTFVERDIRILSEYYQDLLIFDYRFKGGGDFIRVNISFLLFFLRNVAKISDIHSFFVGHHTFFPFWLGKLFGKKCICVLGGTEAHFIPEISYGNYRKPLYKFTTQRSLEWADLIVPVHESLIFHDMGYYASSKRYQGILAFNRPLSAKISTIYCGFEVSNIASDQVATSERVPNSFITSSFLLNGFDYYRKGIDLFISLAESRPEWNFTLVGNELMREIPSNMTHYGSMTSKELNQLYLKHEFYVQLSIAEGFPNAIAEAMLHGCIPVGSNSFGIPTISGQNGVLLPKKDLDLLQDLLDSYMIKVDRKKASIASHVHIKNNFSISRRKELFFKEIGSIG